MLTLLILTILLPLQWGWRKSIRDILKKRYAPCVFGFSWCHRLGVVYSGSRFFNYHNSRFELTAAVFWKEIG
ncbi:hypothetical protein E4T81_13890 [Barnesiella sp. WM24]|nr:hypothetical protein E4T81_13890 [Barnesiella sp. WM24]